MARELFPASAACASAAAARPGPGPVPAEEGPGVGRGLSSAPAQPAATSAPAGRGASSRWHLGRLRTRLVLLAATGVPIVLAAATCPPPAGLLLAILEVLVVGVALTAPQRQAVAASLLAALCFAGLRLAAAPWPAPGAALLSSPALSDQAAWASALLGAGVLLAAAALAIWCAEALAQAPGAEAALLPLAPAAQPTGRARAEWVLAEARRGRRLVTLGLIGVDAPAEYELEPGEREWVMGQLDELLEEGLDGLVAAEHALSEHGPWERLLVLPDVWAEDFRDQAASLVKSARQHLRRQVRVALITFPLDGPSSVEPLEYLERALEVCRAGRSSVSVGRPRVRRMTPDHHTA